jgi:hypothetical protein
VIEHRSSQRGLYDKLQLPENSAAKEFLERLLDDPDQTYHEICIACKSSMLFEDLKIPTPQDLTRYRQRQSREEQRQRVIALMESDAQAIIEGAAKNPGGPLNRFLRNQLSEHIIARFDSEMDNLDPVVLSREAARHALVEQRDRKLDLEADKLELDRTRVELQQKAADLQRDKYKIASDVWAFILGWFTRKNSRFVDELTSDSEELLKELEGWIENAA